MIGKWKKVTAYTGNDNPTINDKLNVKNHMISQLENSIENNANKFIKNENGGNPVLLNSVQININAI